jgi:PAS domain S-box-containing protein
MNDRSDFLTCGALVASRYLVKLLIDSETGRLLDASQAAANFYGYSREELQLLSAWELTPNRSRDETLAMLAEIASGRDLSVRPGSQHRLHSGELRAVRVYPDLVEVDGRVLILATVTDVPEQQETQARWRETEQRWKRVLEGTGHGVWDWHIPTDTLEFSAEWRAMLGYDAADLRGTVAEWIKRVHPDDFVQARAAVQAHLAGETPSYESVIRVRGQDGRWKWLLDRGLVCERDAAGQPLRMLGTHTDITAQKEAEEALGRTRDSLAEAQRISHLGSFEYDAATRQTVWSDEEYRIYGLDPAGPSPVYEAMLAQCIHPEDRDRLHQTFSAALASRSSYELEHRIVRPDGTVRWVYDLAQPYCDTQGALVRYIGTTLDVTERKEAAERLRLSEERLRLALDGARMGTWHWDLVTNEILWSDTYRQLFGLPPDAPGSYEGWLACLHRRIAKPRTSRSARPWTPAPTSIPNTASAGRTARHAGWPPRGASITATTAPPRAWKGSWSTSPRVRPPKRTCRTPSSA